MMKMKRLSFSLFLSHSQLLFVLQLVLIVSQAAADFTCQGTTFAGALVNCPDGGQQEKSMGGNVTVYLKQATNVKNGDFLGISPMSDPYIKMTVGSVVRRSKAIHNSHNPTFNQNINLGVLGSGTLITVEIWDEDSGLEATDDRLHRATVRVPYCSTFNASVSTIDCGQPFGCESDDSLWKMPNRQVCTESGFIAFLDVNNCGTTGTCLEVEFNIVPFTMQVELENPDAIIQTPQLSAATDLAAGAPWTFDFGLPYLDDGSTLIDDRDQDLDNIKGALMLRMDNDERYTGAANEIKFYAGLNFPGRVYVCRAEIDNDFAVPTWLTDDFSAANISVTRVLIDGTDNYFGCYFQEVDGTVKNKYGGVLSGAVPFYTNTITGFDSGLVEDQREYTYMYIVLAVPYFVAPQDGEVLIIYEHLIFILSMFTYGLAWAYYMVLVANFLRKINYRVDRITSYLSSRVLTGEHRSLLAGLLLQYGKSTNNIQFRSYLYHARNTIGFILCIPVVLLVGWGAVLVETMEPPGLGYAIVFIGPAAMFSWYAIKLWEVSKWRMSSLVLQSLGIATGSFMCFIIAMIFGADPVVKQLGENVNFTALSLVFGTLNAIPLLLLIFQQDETQKINLNKVVDKMTEAVCYLKNQPIAQNSKYKNVPVNKLLHAILGEMYTINPKVPEFKYAAVLQELTQKVKSRGVGAKSAWSDPRAARKAAVAEATVATGAASASGKREEEDKEPFTLYGTIMKNKLYVSSVCLLLIYIFIAAGETEYPSLAFLHSLALMLLDTIHLSLTHGDVRWSTGFKILLLLMGRLLIMGSSIGTWILAYSACYLLYALVLLRELMTEYLPVLTKRKAGEIVFSGLDNLRPPSNDIVGSPHFCLGLLTAAFSAVIIITALPRGDGRGVDDGELPIYNVDVLGSEWNVSIFGLIVILVAVVVGLMSATVRAFYLERHGLLRGWARKSFMYHPSIHVPTVFAIFTEVSIIVFGLLVYGINGSAAVLVGCMFLPIIFVCMGNAYKTWIQNDFELVVWPPRRESAPNPFSDGTVAARGGGGEGNAPSDLEKAYNMIDGLFGREDRMVVQDLDGGGQQRALTNGNPETTALREEEGEGGSRTGDGDDESVVSKTPSTQPQTLKGFQLPPLKATGNRIDAEIKMPPLPLKSVLRKKRQNMGIKTSSPVAMKDLRTREDAVDNDKFGDKDDVIDAEDPWAKFELEEGSDDEGENGKGPKKRKIAAVGTLSTWQLIMRSRTVVGIRTFLRTNKTCLSIQAQLRSCGTCLSDNLKLSKVYPAKYKPSRSGGNVGSDDDDDEDDDLDLDLDDELDEDGGMDSARIRRKKRTAADGSSNSSETKREGEVGEEGEGGEDEEEGEREGKQSGSSRLRAARMSKKRRALVLSKQLTPEEMRVKISRMSFGAAFYGGYLSRKDYLAIASWYGGLLAIMFMGVTLSQTVEPAWLGNLIWAAVWMFLFTFVPMVKYFNTFTFDSTMQSMAKFAAVFHFIFFITFLVVRYDGDFDQAGAVWILSYFFYYPIFLYIIFSLYSFCDTGFQFEAIDRNHDGKITFREIMYYMRSFPVLLGLLVFLNIQFYVWVNRTAGTVVTLLILIGAIGYIYIRDWATNDFFLSPELVIVARFAVKFTIFISIFVAVCRENNPIFAISVICFTFAFSCFAEIISTIMLSTEDTDRLFFFSPTVMPVYIYDSRKHAVIDMSHVMKLGLYLLITGVLWGCFMAIFIHPLNIGVAISCSFLLIIAACAAFATSYVPQKLAKSVSMLSPESIIEAAAEAKEKFRDNRTPLNLEMSGWRGKQEGGGGEYGDGLDNSNDYHGDDDDDDALEHGQGGGSKTPAEMLCEKPSIEVAVELLSDTRSLVFAKADNVKHGSVDLGEDDEYEPPFISRMLTAIGSAIHSLINLVVSNFGSNNNKPPRGFRKHAEAEFTLTDALAEAIVTGRGPFGLIGIDGLVYSFFKDLKADPRWKKFYPSWFDHYDEEGNNLRLLKLAVSTDIIGIKTRLVEFDRAVDFTYSEEARCAINFLLVLLVGADAKMQREQVLFQKFLRENRYRMASNGITPPPDIFNSTSYSSINIPLVAIWLTTLSADERDRFYLLKNAFSEEQRERDAVVDKADRELQEEAAELEFQRRSADLAMFEQLNREIYKVKEARVQDFADTLEGYERQRFGQRRDVWTTDLECYVDLKEKDLYERFRIACLAERDEFQEYVVKSLSDIEAGQKDTRLGEYGRAYQFVDNEFPPNDMNIGDGKCAVSVLGWRCAPGVVENVQLFDGGTNPDDIQEGVFNDQWLLSAIEMLVAASDFGGGIINEQIARLFVGHPSPDGELTLDTEVGAYCVRLFKNGAWVPIIIDDILPMRRKEYWTNENRGLASAHNKECRGIWIALIEKAYAKYYGSYTKLERGFVHHALHDLTSCEAEIVPLSAASRGMGKRYLWNTLQRYRKNGYILGAGTGDAKLADREIQDMGIIFNSAYTIYDIFSIDGHKLLRLRNPPGDHGEWRGDWSDKSLLWNRRLKAKLGWSDAEDNVFFMSFDDFCNVFRHLYVCKYYNPRRWLKTSLRGFWKKSDEALVEQMEMMNQFIEDHQGEEVVEVDEEANNRKKAKARLDTAGGLPTKHNPACIVENNPMYSLRIGRPTDLRITVKQFNAKPNVPPVPFSIFVLKNDHPRDPMRVTQMTKANLVDSTGDCQALPTRHLYTTLNPGLYIVMPATYLAGMENSFKCSILSNYRTEFLPVWPPTWMLREEAKAAAAARGEGYSAKQGVGGGMSGKSQAQQMNGWFRKGVKTLLGTSSGMDDEDEDDEDGGGREGDGERSVGGKSVNSFDNAPLAVDVHAANASSSGYDKSQNV